MGKMHEYILFYAKNIDEAETNLLLDKEKNLLIVMKKAAITYILYIILMKHLLQKIGQIYFILFMLIRMKRKEIFILYR